MDGFIRKMFLFIFLVALLIFMNSVYALSIGVSPGRLSFNDVLRGGYAERTITVTTNAQEDLIVDFKVNGDIKDWLRFEPNTTKITLSLNNPYKLKIIVEPPEDARLDTHTGDIVFTTESVGSAGGRAGSFIKAAVTLLASVDMTGDVITACRAGAFGFNDLEINYPLEFGTTIINDGNLRIKPKLSIDIWDQLQQKLLLSKEVVLDEILPTSETRVVKTLKNDLGVGQYWIKMKVDECNAEDFLTFSVLERGGIADKGELIKIINKPWGYTNETIQIKAEFRNTGKRTVYAKFRGHILLGDKIIKTIETEELEVQKGKTTNFEVYFTPEEPGRYVIEGRIIYNKKLSFEKSSVLNINIVPEEEKVAGNLLPLLIYLVIVFTILFIGRKILRERNRRRVY